MFPTTTMEYRLPATYAHTPDTNSFNNGQYTSVTTGRNQKTARFRRSPSLGGTTNESVAFNNHNHTRSKTEFSLPSAGNSLHPLRSAGLSTGPNDAGVTRPHLSRVLNVGTLVDVPLLESESSPTASVEQAYVFVHEITPSDSLAGVSLKYGISMTELRRANQLWASDSIHLRTELYIPVEQASRLRSIPIENLLSITPAEEISDPMDVANRPSSPSHKAEPIHRIPASKLSFFPPPSVSKPTVEKPLSFQEHVIPTNSGVGHARHPSNSLTSLLTSLPIAASTRDDIISRLSFDSTGSSYTESEPDSHELDDVRHADHSTTWRSRDVPRHSDTLATPVATHRTADFDAPSLTSQNTRLPPSQARTHPFSTSPQSYIPSQAQIRTVQMEPSPIMQVPTLVQRLSPSKGKTKASRDLLDVDLELENTSAQRRTRTHPDQPL